MHISLLFSYGFTETHVVGTQKNPLRETILLSTNKIYFGLEIRKLLNKMCVIILIILHYGVIISLQNETLFGSKQGHIIHQLCKAE